MRTVCALLLCLVAAGPAHAQGVARKRIRDHTRPTNITKVNESQAADVTLTLSSASVRPIQHWVRTAGTMDRGGKLLTGYLFPPESGLVKVGQRVRAFPPSSKSSMYQAFVSRVLPQGGRTLVEVTLASSGWKDTTLYVMEIVTDRGEFLSVPNEAIIEEGDRRVVYVQREAGRYTPEEIQTGVQGELYTQVLKGLNEGDQVVTFGSFFIDAEFKLKATDQIPLTSPTSPNPTNNDQHDH
jgi:Cu(I)/Ag(I) efflux system membrane fusion protein